VERWLDALSLEAALYRDAFPPFDTVYIGGGTPSVLAGEEMERLAALVRRSFSIEPSSEWTVEVNPGDATAGLLAVYRDLGINRVNAGVQSFDDETLSFLGRRHDARQAAKAVEALRSAGFDNIGLDLLYGIPGQTVEEWLETLSAALRYEPEHLSCYELTVEPGTPFAGLREKGALPPLPEDLSLRFFMETSRRLTDAGYLHYEVSNFARNASLRSRHNRKYWDHTPYLGLGPSAHSFLDGRRWWNREDLEAWEKALREGRRPVEGEEVLTGGQRCLESLFLGLRTSEGIPLGRFREENGIDLLAEPGDLVERSVAEGLLVLEGEVLKPTVRGMAVADGLARLFSESLLLRDGVSGPSDT
jgi:oxygen-independent coproporphyrinogen-3 oxidase